MWLTAGYTYASTFFTIIVAAPQYFKNQIHLGQMFQVIDAYNHVQTGFSFIIDSFTRLAQWKAAVNRLNNFSKGMSYTKVSISKISLITLDKKEQKQLVIDKLNIYHPNGFRLIKELGINLNARRTADYYWTE